MHQPDRTKKLRFNPSSPARDQPRPGTPPTRGYLSSSRSARAKETQEGDQSPYDSGYDSTYSTASGPGNPPSNTGSDIDDQAFQLISDIRSARTTTPHGPHAPTTDEDSNNNHPTHTTAPYPSLSTVNNPLDDDSSDGPPPLIPDSDDSDSDSDGAFAHDRDDDCRSTSGPSAANQDIANNQASFRTQPRQTWSHIMAGNQHNHPWTRSQPRPRAHYQDRHEDDYTFDVRMATKDSTSTPRDETDNPTYWHQPLTPTSFSNPKPPTLTSAQTAMWRHSGLHWYAHIHIAFTEEDIKDLETRPPPILRRTLPNIEYMDSNPHSPDKPFTIQSRLDLFTRSGKDWGTYIDGLAPSLRLHYQSQPPPPRQTTNSSSQYHRTYERVQAPIRIHPPREHTPTAPERYNPSNRTRGQPPTTLEGYNPANLYGKRDSENQTQEQPSATNNTSIGGYEPTHPLPHNPYNPHNRSIPNPQPIHKKHRLAPATSPQTEEQSYKRRQSSNREHGNYKPNRPATKARQDSCPDPPGEPWCDCCTATLSDDDNTKWAIQSTTHPHTRYRTSAPNEFTPPRLHSNLHRDYLRLYRANRQHHRAQRIAHQKQEAYIGAYEEYTPHTTYTNTPEVTELPTTIANLQYARYIERGGQRPQGPHASDFPYNSPQHHNMQTGQNYRTWFHSEVSHNYHTLGAATNMYYDWFLATSTQPEPPLSRPPPQGTEGQSDNDSDPPRANNSSRYNGPRAQTNRITANTTAHNNTPHQPSPPHRTASEDDNATIEDNDSDHNSTHNIYAQTTPETLRADPDDPTAVLDTGAMMTTIPRRLILGTKWEASIRPATPGTTIRYGNMETESVEETTTIGDYKASLVPDRYSTALICVHDITMSGHTVIFTNTATIVEDIGGRYSIHIPRAPTSREWRTPLNILHRLTTLRHLHPLTDTLPHPDQTHIA